MAVEGLGRAFNLATSTGLVATATRVNLKNYAGCTIVVTGATSGAATINEANAASGGTSQALAKVVRYYTQNNGVWTKVTQAAASTVTAATGGLLAVYIDGTQLSDGFTYLLAGHASGTITYILHDVEVQRAPANLVNVTA